VLRVIDDTTVLRTGASQHLRVLSTHSIISTNEQLHEELNQLAPFEFLYNKSDKETSPGVK